MDKTGAVCPDCGAKTDECPCWNCGHDFCEEHEGMELDYMKVTDEDFGLELGIGLTPEQVKYLKANKEELSANIAEIIMEDYWMPVARKAAKVLLEDAGLL